MGRLVLPAGFRLPSSKAAGDWSTLGSHKSPISGDPCIDLAVGGRAVVCLIWQGVDCGASE